jgi:hypothetical protein
VLELLSNPVIDEQRKKELVKRLAAEASFSQYTVNFLSLLIDQSRIEALEQICESFEKSYCQLTDTQVCRQHIGAGGKGGGAAGVRGPRAGAQGMLPAGLRRRARRHLRGVPLQPACFGQLHAALFGAGCL